MKSLTFRKSFIYFVATYFLINLGYQQLFPNGSKINDFLRVSETAIVVQALGVFYDDLTVTSVVRATGEKSEEIYAGKNRLMGIINECDTLKIHLIYSLFLVFITTSKSRWLFLGLGNAVIYFVNVIRLVILTLMSDHMPDSFSFHHEYTFSLLMYLIVFVMWYFYIKEKEESVE